MRKTGRLLLMFFVCSMAVAQTSQPTTPTAQSLQRTLDKIVFAHQVTVISKVAVQSRHKETSADVQSALAGAPLQFSVSDFSTGSVTSIMNRRLIDLVTWLPNFRTINISNSTVIVSDEHGVVGTEREANVSWTGGNEPSGPSTIPTNAFADAIKETPRYGTCSGYFTATITATYKGQTGQWRSLYLTGCTDGMMAVDLVMGDAVPNFWDADIYPYILMQGQRGRSPAVQEWLHGHASATCTGKQLCYENGSFVVPKETIPSSLQGMAQPPNTGD